MESAIILAEAEAYKDMDAGRLPLSHTSGIVSMPHWLISAPESELGEATKPALQSQEAEDPWHALM